MSTFDSSLDSLRSSYHPVDETGYPIYPECLASQGLGYWPTTLRYLGDAYVSDDVSYDMFNMFWQGNLNTARGYLIRNSHVSHYELMRLSLLLQKYFEATRLYWLRRRPISQDIPRPACAA